MSSTDAYQRWLEGYSTESLESGFADEIIDRLQMQDPIGVTPDTTLRTCIDTMKQARIGCLLVGHDKQVVGIFTERDLLNKIVGTDIDLDTAQVQDFMTSDPDCLEGGERIVQALALMVEGGFRHVPVLRDGRAIGVFGMRHCMELMVDLFPEAVLNAPPPRQGYSENREGA